MVVSVVLLLVVNGGAWADKSEQLTGLDIVGSREVAENLHAQYKAIASYNDETTQDVTDLADWSIDPNSIAQITAGLLETKMIDVPTDITITAHYSEGDVKMTADKDVSVFAICPEGYALDFDGINDYVDLGSPAILVPQKITIQAWIKRASAGSTMSIVSKDRSRWERVWQFRVTQSGFLEFIPFKNDDEFIIVTGRTQINPNLWYHVTATWDGDTVKLFVNGQPDGEAAYEGVLHQGETNHIFIGRMETASPQFFNGLIDDVAMYDRAVSLEEIQMNMHAGPDIYDPNLIGYWDFDDGEGQVAADMSGNGNDGQLGATPEIDDSDPNWVLSDAPVGICTKRQIVERNLTDVLQTKKDILMQLNETVEQERELLYYMCKNYRDIFDKMHRRTVFKGMIDIYQAIRDEQRAKKSIDRSVDRIEEASRRLGIDSDSQD